MNKLIIHLEGLFVLVVSIYFYFQNGFQLGYFILFLLLPDISMLGYAANKKVGAILYNVGHSYVLPVLLVINAVHFNAHFLLAGSLIWLAHIGMDRMIGYGLKYPSDFKDTHMQRI